MSTFCQSDYPLYLLSEPETLSAPFLNSLCTFAQSFPAESSFRKGSVMFYRFDSTLIYMLGADISAVSPDSVTRSRRPRFPHCSEVVSPDRSKNLTLPDVQALTLDWLFDPVKERSLVPLFEAPAREATDRILARLVQFEAHEPQAHLKDDYRQAFITVSLAAKGTPQPFVNASYSMYGVHPDKLWKKMQDRKRAQLGIDFELDQLEHDLALKAQSPQKSPSSVVTQKRKLA